MQTEIFCLCKDFKLSHTNHYNIIDCFDEKWADGEPMLVEPFFVVAAIRFYLKDRGNHTLTLKCHDKNGVQQFNPVPDTYSIIDFQHDSVLFFYHCPMGRTVLKFGTYQFSIECDGTQLAHTPLYLVQGKPPPVFPRSIQKPLE